MTREEQINQMAEEYAKMMLGDEYQPYEGPYTDCINDTVYGAKWADEHPNLYNDEKYHTIKVSCLDELDRKAKLYDEFIEKACEWLNDEFSQMQDRDGHPNVESRSCISVEELIQDFRKAMEE